VVTQIRKAGDNKTIQFNMKDDEKVRDLARRGYEIAKHLKAAGVKFKKVIPASVDASVRKLFKLAPNSNHISIEIKMTGDETADMLAIEDLKNQLLILDTIRLVDEKKYQYERGNIVHRFLIVLEPRVTNG